MMMIFTALLSKGKSLFTSIFASLALAIHFPVELKQKDRFRIVTGHNTGLTVLRNVTAICRYIVYLQRTF